MLMLLTGVRVGTTFTVPTIKQTTVDTLIKAFSRGQMAGKHTDPFTRQCPGAVFEILSVLVFMSRSAFLLYTWAPHSPLCRPSHMRSEAMDQWFQPHNDPALNGPNLLKTACNSSCYQRRELP